MSSTHSAWLGEACSNQLAVFRDWFPHTFPSGPAMLQLKTYQVPESYGFTLWNILSYMYSVKLKFPFCRCGLLFGSQQSSEERNSLCIHAARIFNELLQDWNGPSQWLLHEGTAFPASLWKHKRVLLKKKKKHVSSSKSEENLFLSRSQTCTALHVVIVNHISNCTSSV